jgi:serine protease AprX
MSRLNERGALSPPHLPQHARRRVPRCLLYAACASVALLQASILTARADEFTVGHTGADVARSQYGLDGSGITVAVIDSGSFKVPDLATKVNGVNVTRIVTTVNFLKDGKTDPLGHGTHVAGIIAGNGASSSGSSCYRTFTGIAQNANLAILRVLDENGESSVSQVITAIQWAVDHKAQYNIRVINLSLGHPVGESYTTDPLCQAVEKAWQAGIVVVCAAGNNGRQSDIANPLSTDNEGFGTNYGAIQSPGNDPCVITVGAMKNVDGSRPHDRIATYSSRGPSRLDFVMKPDIVAPGNKIISTDVGGDYSTTLHTPDNMIPFNAYMRTTSMGISHAYFQLSGTSMAAPVVSGAAALMLQANPALTPDAIKARLMISADKMVGADGKADPCTYGAGYLNIPAALACAAMPTMAAKSPTLSRDDKGNVYVDANLVIWGTDAKGSIVIWGVSGVNNLQVIWGTQVLWGTSTNILNGSLVIWGTSVWSDLVIWGTSNSSVDLSGTAVRGE